MSSYITIAGRTLHVGDRVIIGWRHFAGNQGARFGVISKITPSGYIYAGGERYRGEAFPLYRRRPRYAGQGSYTYTLMLNTPENRAYYGMPETAPEGMNFKKPRAGTEAEILKALSARERQLLMIIGDLRKHDRFAASTFTGLRAAKLITSGYPESLTELGKRVRGYAEQNATTEAANAESK